MRSCPARFEVLIGDCNSYPGIACDIPAHAYQFTFENNPTWSSYYAPGSEIHAYLKRVATKYDAYKYMKFRNRCNKAEWNDAEGKWYIDMEDLEAGKVCLMYSMSLMGDFTITLLF